MLNNESNRPKVTVEDLLRLKRMERPSKEFWTGFEAELRQKQLAALLEKRPWWHSLVEFPVRRAWVPVGAAALFAFSFVSVQYYTSSTGTSDPGFEPVRVAKNAPASAADETTASFAANRDEVPAVIAEAVMAGGEIESPEVTHIAATLPENAASLTPWSAPRSEDTPSARALAANLARLEQNEPELLRALASSQLIVAAPTRQVEARPAIELASVSINSPARSNRLLARYDDRMFVPEPTAPDIVRERLARRLGDPELLDQIRRLDLKADRVSLKL